MHTSCAITMLLVTLGANPAQRLSLPFHDVQPVDALLQAGLEQIDASLRARFDMTTEQAAVGVVDLVHSRAAMIHPDRIEYAASLAKIGILLAYFQLHPEAAASLDATTQHELGMMAKISSNEMAAKYSRQMGLKAIQRVLEEQGFYDKDRGGGIWVGKHYGKGDERYVDPVGGHSHAVTVRQVLRYFLLLEQGRLLSPEASSRMREIFAAPELPHDNIKFVKGLEDRGAQRIGESGASRPAAGPQSNSPSQDVQIIRKWGTWQDWRHDAAVIKANDRHYILVALTRHPRGDDYLVELAKAVDDLMRRTGETGRPDAKAQTIQADQRDAADDAPEAEKKGRAELEWLPFPDDAKFKVRGLHWFAENGSHLWRMPKDKFDTLPSGVKRRCLIPAGGRIVMRCNTTKLGLKVTPLSKGGLKGFDVYVNGSRSAVAEEAGTKSDVVLFKDLDRKEKEIVIYLPHQQEVMIESVGVDMDTKFNSPEHEYAKPLPVVFYGSSVCQGTGAARPGMSYAAIVCRELNLDFINLGFGGAGKAEKVVVDLVNSIPAYCYVFDLGKSYGMQDKTAYKDMLQAVRESHPDTPLICITPITSSLELHSAEYASKSAHTRMVVQDAVNDLLASGEKKVYLIDGTELLSFDEHDGLSKDGVHPSDHGFNIIARKLLPAVKQALGL